jgi:hypothetical protein
MANNNEFVSLGGIEFMILDSFPPIAQTLLDNAILVLHAVMVTAKSDKSDQIQDKHAVVKKGIFTLKSADCPYLPLCITNLGLFNSIILLSCQNKLYTDILPIHPANSKTLSHLTNRTKIETTCQKVTVWSNATAGSFDRIEGSAPRCEVELRCVDTITNLW